MDAVAPLLLIFAGGAVSINAVLLDAGGAKGIQFNRVNHEVQDRKESVES